MKTKQRLGMLILAALAAPSCQDQPQPVDPDGPRPVEAEAVEPGVDEPFILTGADAMAEWLSWKTGQPTTAVDVLMMGSEADRIFLDHSLELDRTALGTVNGDTAERLRSSIEAAERMLESLETLPGHLALAAAADGDGACAGDPTIASAATDMKVDRSMPGTIAVYSRSHQRTEAAAYHQRTENAITVYNTETDEVVSQTSGAKGDYNCVKNAQAVQQFMLISTLTANLDALCVMAHGYHKGWNDHDDQSEAETAGVDGCVDLTGNSPGIPDPPPGIIPGSISAARGWQ